MLFLRLGGFCVALHAGNDLADFGRDAPLNLALLRLGLQQARMAVAVALLQIADSPPDFRLLSAERGDERIGQDFSDAAQRGRVAGRFLERDETGFAIGALGALLLGIVLRELGSSSAVASSFGLREGLLYGALDRQTRSLDPLIVAARRRGRSTSI